MDEKAMKQQTSSTLDIFDYPVPQEFNQMSIRGLVQNKLLSRIDAKKK